MSSVPDVHFAPLDSVYADDCGWIHSVSRSFAGPLASSQQEPAGSCWRSQGQENPGTHDWNFSYLTSCGPVLYFLKVVFIKFLRFIMLRQCMCMRRGR